MNLGPELTAVGSRQLGALTATDIFKSATIPRCSFSHHGLGGLVQPGQELSLLWDGQQVKYSPQSQEQDFLLVFQVQAGPGQKIGTN